MERTVEQEIEFINTGTINIFEHYLYLVVAQGCFFRGGKSPFRIKIGEGV